MQADDESGVGKFAASEAPINRWFREQMKQVHGIDIAESGSPPQKVHDINL